MDREVCGVCGAWKGDDELIALRQDLAAARALLRDAKKYVPAQLGNAILDALAAGDKA